MQTIAFFEGKNNVPKSFCPEILKCLPDEVTKVVLEPFIHIIIPQGATKLPKSTLVILVADEIKRVNISN